MECRAVPDLLINDVDDALHARLKARALTHRRSLADEARETLRNAVAGEAMSAAPVDIVGLFAQQFGAEHGVTLDLPARGTEPDRSPPDFSRPEYDR